MIVELVYSRYRTQTHDLDILMKKLVRFMCEGVKFFLKIPKLINKLTSGCTKHILQRVMIRYTKSNKMS